MPFAGHPTIGTAILLAELRTPLVNGERDAIIVLEQAIGTVRVGVRLRAGQAPFAEFDAPKLPEKTGTLAARDRLADALGLLPREIGFENHTALRVTAGNTFAFVPVISLEAIARARVNAALWAATVPASEIDGVYLYTRQCVHNGSAFHARMFAPQLGVPEDPATGSAAVGFAGVVHEFDGLPDGAHKRVIEQGHEMGRPSSIVLTLVVERRQARHRAHRRQCGARRRGHAGDLSAAAIRALTAPGSDLLTGQSVGPRRTSAKRRRCTKSCRMRQPLAIDWQLLPPRGAVPPRPFGARLPASDPPP